MVDRVKVNTGTETKGEMLSRVNRLLPFAISSGVLERHYNLRKIMKHMKLHKI